MLREHKKCFLALLFCFLLSGCATELSGFPAQLDRVEFPVGFAVHPSGRYGYLINSNFNLDYRSSDGGALLVVDLEKNEIVSETSKRIGSFGTSVVLNPEGTRGYVVTRSDDYLSWFAISEDGRRIYCPEAPEADNLLSCRVSVPDDPADISVVRSYRESSSGERTSFDLVMIPHMIDSKVSAITLQDLPDGHVSVSKNSASLVYGASEVLWHSGEKFFVTGRSATDLALLYPALSETGEVVGLGVASRISTPTAYTSYKGRGMALDPSKRSLYLLNQSPNSIMAFDVSGELNGSDAGNSSVLRALELMPRNPSKIAWIGGQQDGVLYVTSFQEDTLLIMDPDTLSIFTQISVGDGPYNMVYDKERSRVLISHFRSNDIWVYDVSDPRSPVLQKKLLGTVAD